MDNATSLKRGTVAVLVAYSTTVFVPTSTFIKRESAKAAHEDRQDAGGLQLVAWVELEATNRRDSPEGRASERLALFSSTPLSRLGRHICKAEQLEAVLQ